MQNGRLATMTGDAAHKQYRTVTSQTPQTTFARSTQRMCCDMFPELR